LPQEQEGAGKPARVLLVMDDPRAALMVGEMIRSAWRGGLVISQTASVGDAMHELLDHGATCVLLDLPFEPPADAIEYLSSAAPHTPIIVLAGQPDEETETTAVRAGAQDVLVTAELTPAVLARAIRHAIERKRTEATLALQALHDPLTALPNRALFLDRLRVALDRSRRMGTPVVVMFLDVDRFKHINDSLGHAAGDVVLTVLADRFSRLLRPMDTVARFGGDEFTFLFEGVDGDQEAALLAERICEAARLPMELAGAQRSITVSCGVNVVRDPETPVEDTVRDADAAMYLAKDLGGARYELYVEIPPADPHPLAAVPSLAAPLPPIESLDADLEPALRVALDQAELRVHYQPRVSINGETGLVGFEALVRWDHPEHGLMEPVEFIPLAERTGLIVPIGAWVIEQALRQIGLWRRSRPDMTVSVNLSRRQLEDAELLDRLRTAIDRAGYDPSVLCLEVSETAVAAAPEVAARQLAALHDLGVTLAIDDYGTGDTPREHLGQMPVQVLKIDRTLVAGIGPAGDDATGVRAAVELGHALGLSVVAEGVETDAQLAALRELGCDGAQGYLFSQPVSDEGVVGLLALR